MVKPTEQKITEKSPAIDLNKILNQARGSFGKGEKALAQQLSTGSSLVKPTRDDQFVLYPGEHWGQLTGTRGIPFGKIVQIAGKPDSGKSSHGMAFMTSAQKAGHVVILWDSESKFSATRMDNYFKGNSSELLLVNSRVILTGGDMLIALTKSILDNYPDKKVFICWDSVGGTLSSAEDVKNLRDSRQMAIAAKENKQVLHGIINLMEAYRNKESGEEKIAMLMINQTYANIGSVGQKEAGGQGVEYYSSLILQLTRKGDLNKQRDGVKRKIGILSRAKVKKNHLFDGEDSIAELDLQITAGGIELAKKVKETDDGGFDDESEDGE